MIASSQNSFRLFRFAGIQVYLHWSWFLIAAYDFSSRQSLYSSPIWNIVELVAFFGIVLLHEFGHSLACRQVGGTSDTIVLWPLGGLAYVRPPQRAGAQLWSIAAGPLVNVVIGAVLFALRRSGDFRAWIVVRPDLFHLYRELDWANICLLIFNLMPIYPLDGGQILRSLLWFGLGRARSLLVASAIGFVGTAGMAAWAIFDLVQPDRDRSNAVWLGLIAFFLFQQCVRGFQHAKTIQKLEQLPRHAGVSCPSCHAAPPAAEIFACPKCSHALDPFVSGGRCPHCGNQLAKIPCVYCGEVHTAEEWKIVPPPMSRPPDTINI